MSGSGMKDNSGADSLQVYFKEIRDESLLTSAEECSLAEAIAGGDKDARWSENDSGQTCGFGGRRSQRDLHGGRGMVLEDLIGEGNIGLIRATEEFEPRFGTKFDQPAAPPGSNKSIRHALINTTSTIRLPAHMVGLLTKWRRSERKLCRDLGRTPSFDEVASHLGLSETQKSLVAKAHQARQLKLESSVAVGAGWRSLSGSDDRSTAPDAVLEAGDEWNILWSRIERLDARERTILVLRYGLEGASPLTLKEIGQPAQGFCRPSTWRISPMASKHCPENHELLAHDSGWRNS